MGFGGLFDRAAIGGIPGTVVTAIVGSALAAGVPSEQC